MAQRPRLISGCFNKKKIIGSFLDGTAIVSMAVLSASFFRYLFFANSNFIWSRNLKVTMAEITPSIRPWLNPKDGIEVYALFVLVLFDIIFTVFLWLLYKKIHNFKSEKLKIAVLAIFWAMAIVTMRNFLLKVGFNPPNFSIAPWPVALKFSGISLLVLLSSLMIKEKILKMFDVSIFVLLIPVVFIPFSSSAWNDYAYIFSPALRLFHHFSVSEIYFQYDLFLSLIALVFLKLKISLIFFPFLGRISLYFFFLFSFILSKKLFKNKRIPYFLLLTLVLVKIYSLAHDPVLLFQATPLRLDLWIGLLWIGFTKGLNSKWFGIALGLLILLHNAFGLIYTISFVLSMAVIFISEFMRVGLRKEDVKSFLHKYSFNLILPIVALFAHTLIFKSNSLEAVSTYQKIGIGFFPIDQTSFYWYVVILLGVAFLSLFRLKKELPRNYFQAGIFLIFLALGNSMYFFGRSVDENIINISASLIFVFYLVVDLHADATPNQNHGFATSKNACNLLSILLVVLLVIFYSGRIDQKVRYQYDNRFFYKKAVSEMLTYNRERLAKIVNNSSKVYFMSSNDFYYYYQGGYVPQGYFSPYSAWVYEKDLVNFLQNLLNDGYYLVIPQTEIVRDQDVLVQLRYNNKVEDINMRVMSQ